ncbi:MAG: type IV secretory system conjugative DNA transfer family protein [Minisyncoccia bacterium]
MSTAIIQFVSIIIFFIGLLLLFGFFIYIKWQRKQKLVKSLQTSLLLIQLPKESKENKNFKDEINKTEQLFNALASLKEGFTFEIAVPYIGEEIYFYLSVNSKYVDAVMKEITAIWPGAQVDVVSEYNVFNNNGVSLGAYLTQKHHFAIPIRTYQEMEVDSFSVILGGFAQISKHGQGASIQLVCKPNTTQESILKKIVYQLKQGKTFNSIINTVSKNININEIIDSIYLFQPNLKEESQKPKEKVIDEEMIKALEKKTAKQLFDINIRFVASAENQMETESILSQLTSGFAQFSAVFRNDFAIVKSRNMYNFFYEFIYRLFNPGENVILNTEEIASLFHLPTPFTDIPRIKWLKAREAEPPVNLPSQGVLIGKSIFRDSLREVYISDEDRPRHIYVIGQTGTGKSTLLSNMVISDINRDKGVCIVDPHGDLVEKIAGCIPERRYDDVIIFDPGDLSRPLGLNMLEYNFEHPAEKTFIVNEIQSIFNKLFAQETMGPMFEQYMRNALLLLMEDMANEPATLVEVPRVFTDDEYRERKLGRITNTIVIDFWTKEAIKVGGEASLANIAPYITSKFNNFLANDYVRPIIGQYKSAFNFRKAMDENKIILVNLSKGKIGDINANLLGMIIIGKILMAALSRVDIPQEQRKDFNLFIDEFQNFTTDSIVSILSEARKYHLNLTIAHQFINQLNEKIRDAVFGNVGSIIAFRVGAQDAEFLVKQFEPVFTASDLMNIDNFHAYVKILIHNTTAKPFNIAIDPPVPSNFSLAQELKRLSSLKYGKPLEEIELEIHRRLRE